LEVDSRAPTILPVAGNYTKLMIEGYVRASTAYTLEGIVLGAYVSTVESDLKYYLNASTLGKPAINRASAGTASAGPAPWCPRTSTSQWPLLQTPHPQANVHAVVDAVGPTHSALAGQCIYHHPHLRVRPPFSHRTPSATTRGALSPSEGQGGGRGLPLRGRRGRWRRSSRL
jgi:hypothetical protein